MNSEEKLIPIWLVWEWKKIKETDENVYAFPRLAEVAERQKKVMLNDSIIPRSKYLIEVEIESSFANHPFGYRELEIIRKNPASPT